MTKVSFALTDEQGVYASTDACAKVLKILRTTCDRLGGFKDYIEVFKVRWSGRDSAVVTAIVNLGVAGKIEAEMTITPEFLSWEGEMTAAGFLARRIHGFVGLPIAQAETAILKLQIAVHDIEANLAM